MTSFSCLLLLTVACFIVAQATAARPNPCAVGGDDKSVHCTSDKVCAATSSPGRRSFQCTTLPPGPGCVCPKIYSPVCCRIRQGSRTITITRGNSCTCGCLKGQVLFGGMCRRPPTALVPCTRELDRTCCYVPKFDLTFISNNRCLCTRAARGIIVSDGLCKIR